VQMQYQYSETVSVVHMKQMLSSATFELFSIYLLTR
jgi:hypothetical protein